MEKIKTLPVKGTEDIAPKRMMLLEGMLSKIKEIYSRNGFNQIQTPILENLELLSKGDSGDNSKMMFKTVKRGAKLDLAKPNLTEEDIVEEGLRYDLTVPLSRFYANNANDLPNPFKAFQIGESFRAEKPQKGRYREFTQCDIDIFGEGSILAEVEILSTIMQVYSSLGIDNIVIKVNDRRILNQIIKNANFSKEDLPNILISIDKYDKIGLNGVKAELLELGYEQLKVDALLNCMQDIADNGLEQCLKYNIDKSLIDSLMSLLAVINKGAPKGYKAIYDVFIIRGQGYYTGTVFEAYCQNSSMARAVGGGGRYDGGLHNRVANMTVYSVGYGLGLIPCLLVLEEKNINLYNQIKKIALIYSKNDDIQKVVDVKNELMKSYCVSLMPEPKNYQSFIIKMQNVGYSGLYKLKDNKLIWF